MMMLMIKIIRLKNLRIRLPLLNRQNLLNIFQTKNLFLENKKSKKDQTLLSKSMKENNKSNSSHNKKS